MLQKTVFSALPQEGVLYACAYGSKAVSQHNYNAKNSLLDLLLVVRDTAQWHLLNAERNPRHYSFICRNSSTVNSLQTLGAGLYYNTNVLLGNIPAKYGVISRKDCLDDLLNWRHLYLAGRLHKPILPLLNCNEISEAVAMNRKHSLLVALLMLPSRFDTLQLLRTIVGISYHGDFRMQLGGEHPLKIEKIVNGQRESLESMYPIQDRATRKGNGWIQDVSPLARLHLLTQTPSNLQRVLQRRHSLFELASLEHQELEAALRTALGAIVRWPAIVQAAKGVITAGPTQAFAYSLAKLMKRFST